MAFKLSGEQYAHLYKTVDVEKCPRCGQHHAIVLFVRLSGEPIDFDGVATHWAECPDTDEPIVLYTSHGFEEAC